MHVLGRGFSQRRKSSIKRPRDLHIRKVSFSGCSLSSGCSFSSTSSSSTSSTARTHIADGHRGSHPSGVDPLSLHPTFQPPPRLYERPFIADSQHYEQPVSTFYDSEDEEEDDVIEEKDVIDEQPFEMELPPHASPSDHTGHERQEPTDYFMSALTKRPPLPRSHWSESTIQTIDSITPNPPSVATPLDDNDDDISVLEMPSLSRRSSNFTFNFSLKRNTVPKRPPMKPMDSVENFIKRGGWKRRGIVFKQDDVEDKSDRSSFVN